MQKQAQQPVKGKEEKGPLVQIKLGTGKASGRGDGVESSGMKKAGLKKGGFRSAFGSVDDEEQVDLKRNANSGAREVKGSFAQDEDSDYTDEEDYYDPRQPTGCMPGCKSTARAAVA